MEKPGLDLSLERRKAIVARLSAELQSRLRGQDMSPLLMPNEEITKRLRTEEKYVKFNAWCKKYGVKNDSTEYPVAFGEHG